MLMESSCAFSEYFGQEGSLLAQAQNFHDDVDPLQFLDNTGTKDDFNFVEVPVDYAKTNTEKMKSSSACYDNNPISSFKHNFFIIGPVVTEFCNRSLTSGISPNSLKKAKIKCIFKKGSRSEVDKYRTISTLPAFGKI